MSYESDTSVFDIAIVGGGINGAGIARDAAGRGLRVALFEQDDLAGHTSSKSTKLIHGGLRYLEYCEFRLVREALKEREVLLNIAPHITRPQRFVLPQMLGARPAWLIRLGLFVYDRLGGRTSLSPSHAVRLGDTLFGAPLRRDLRRGFIYSDAWVDDARLVVLNARDAADKGSQIHTRTQVQTVRRLADGWDLQVQSTGNTPRSVRARALVNAAGPWVDMVFRLASPNTSKAAVRMVKGSHIVVPRLFEGEHAYLLQNEDGRIIFAIPYQEKFTLIGTTDVPYHDDPAAVTISSAELQYLCNSTNRFFRTAIAQEDVVWSYSGVRPLYDDRSENAAAVTRDYVLDLDLDNAGASPLLSIYGGKITTYRRLAEQALEKLLPHIGVRHSRPWTGRSPLPGGDMAPTAVLEQLSREHPYLAPPLAARLARAYGSQAFAILGEARRMEDLGRVFADLSEAEVSYLVRREWARSAEDILWRRTKVGLHMSAAERTEFGEWFACRLPQMSV